MISHLIAILLGALLGCPLGYALYCMTEYVVEHIKISANTNSKELEQTDPVIKGLRRMKDDFGGMAYVVVDNKKYSLDELLNELENHTEVGQKFRDDIYGMILAYLMKFTGED